LGAGGSSGMPVSSYVFDPTALHIGREVMRQANRNATPPANAQSNMHDTRNLESFE